MSFPAAKHSRQDSSPQHWGIDASHVAMGRMPFEWETNHVGQIEQTPFCTVLSCECVSINVTFRRFDEGGTAPCVRKGV